MIIVKRHKTWFKFPNYETKFDLKSTAGAGTPDFGKINLINLKPERDKLDIDKVAELDVNELKTVAADLRNLRHAVNKEVVKKDVYDELVKTLSTSEANNAIGFTKKI